ncbi:glucosamine (N-acetyl)-6-sulfatase precursor [Nasonia vitripennis]|uniref:Sulfatase N-terminal domain-containing protein n=1 Tax=Nasonia vitripennis TaxID=7425 RepID=A0A7M6UCQ7_NASVI|nr:glucosamine (N-acetyl)-6-sulfatase precursor [Nasonia vitripennis]
MVSVMMCVSKVLLFFASAIITCASAKNIVLIIADDLDSVLDGMTPLAYTQRLIANEGMTFKNAFTASPICCPNRASILTGRYQHNHGTYNNSLEGGCYSSTWQRDHEPNTFAAILKQQMKYKTFYAGKYLNKYGQRNGVSRVPPGWDKWYGLIGNSRYYDYSLSINGAEKKYGSSPTDYLTDVIQGFAIDFLKTQKKDQPFLMVLAPPAPHEPFIPAPRHNDKYKGTKAKRTKNFNTSSQRDKHWLVRRGPSPLPDSVVARLDDIYRKRWESLLAVDELVQKVYSQLKSQNLLDDTYIIFTSDNGFHVGQFSLPYDKRQPYETDIKIPLMIRGPNITRLTEVKSAVSSVDLFATILEIAGVERPSDGVSLLDASNINDRTVLIEYKGERSTTVQNTGCPADDADLNLSQCDKNFACKCQDVANNTFTCVRRVATHYDNVFCLFAEDDEFVESYDILHDEFQMDNIGPDMNRGQRYRFRKRVKKMSICKDRTCIATNPPLNH